LFDISNGCPWIGNNFRQIVSAEHIEGNGGFLSARWEVSSFSLDVCGLRVPSFCRERFDG
jgi:hypothetical protein